MQLPIIDQVPESKTRDCTDPWHIRFFHANNSVSICCWAKPIGYLSEGLGVIDERAEKVKLGLLTGQLNEYCQRCPAKSITDIVSLRTKIVELKNKLWISQKG